MSERVYRKWNYKLHKYEPYRVPAEKRLVTYETDMRKIVNCAQCLKELPVEETYTSLEVHAQGGAGYAVCGKCYEKEVERKRKYHE